MRLPIIISLLLLFIANAISADCICNYLKTTTLDTLAPGEVKAERCYHYVNGDTCFIDTSYEKDLLAGLLGEYNSKQYAIIGSITEVQIIPETLWLEDFRRESLLITIDTCFKGDFPLSEFWVQYGGSCKALSSGLLNSKFIAFFDSFNNLSDLAIDPGFDCGEASGYFLVNGNIVKTGDAPAGMPGISVDPGRFLETANKEYNERKVFIISRLTVFPSPFNPAAHIVLNNGAPGRVTLGIYNIKGESVKRMDLGHQPRGTVEIIWDGKDDGGHHLVSGAYFIKATAGNTALTKKAVLIR